jgi:2,4-dienoyl-CoA reductase-like NADH-dependent reductase (Old Yellow Enzyme family)
MSLTETGTAPAAPIAAPFFEPITLRGMTARNRVAMAPMTREFSPSGIPGPDVVEYYRRRAAGGVGLIVTEGVGIDHPFSVDGTGIPHLYGDSALAGWAAVVDAVHAEGAVIVPQLWHQGCLRDPQRSALPQAAGHRPSGLWGTPGVVSYEPDYIARVSRPTAPMTEEEIADVIAAFARSARHAAAAGFDGIAIHGAHGYLIDSFFWRDTNRRTDRWGGEAQARAQFGVEIVRAIRQEIGETMPIIFRFSQHKQQDYKARFADTPDELGIILGALADAGVDLFDASSRRFDMTTFDGSDLTLAGWARKLTGKPSMAVGGIGLNNWLQDTFKGRGDTLAINNLDEVRRLYDCGMFDMIAVGRALISDPQWVMKARSGTPFIPYDITSLGRLT